MISLKDYAAQKGISYEAVRQQVNRYAADLEGHITKVNRTQFLDDEAVAFLDQKRAGNPVVIIQQGKDEQIEQLQEQVDLLKSKVIALYERIDRKEEEISRLTAENQALLAAAPEVEDETSIDVADETEPEAAPELPTPEEKASLKQRIRFLITGKM